MWLVFISLPGAAPDQSMSWSVVRRPSLAFHIFDISSRTISCIDLKLSWRHRGNMEIQIAKIVPFRYRSRKNTYIILTPLKPTFV